MFTITEISSLSEVQSSFRILKPWWDVCLDYLTIVMMMLSIFAGTMQFSRDQVYCLPKLEHNMTCTFEGIVNLHSAVSAAQNVKPSGKSSGMEYIQYMFVNQKCYNDALPWISKYIPFLALIHTIILMASNNFWFKYPKTSSKIEHFVSILGKCFESPWTTKALSETACEESETVGGNQQVRSLSKESSVTVSTKRDFLSNIGGTSGDGSASGTPLLQTKSNVANPHEKPMESPMRGGGETILDKKDGEQAKALFEKVRKFRLHVEESDTIYKLYALQCVVKTLKILFILGYTVYFVDRITFVHECVPDVEDFVGYSTFCCTHNLAPILKKILYTYMAVIALFGFVCFYTLVWLFKRPLKEYSFEKVREESNFSDIPDVKNDFAFLLHMIDLYDALYSKRFAVFLSEVSENKLRQLSLNQEWSYEKLRQHVNTNMQDRLELHLFMLSGVPESVFDIADLEVLKLELIPEVKLPAKITQMTRLQELWLHHCPAKCDATALSFLRDRLWSLHIKFTDVNEIPQWIYTLRNLHELYLYGNLNSENNKVIALESLRELRHLKILLLKSNLSKIPSNLTDASTHLQKLYIHNDGTKIVVWNNLKKFITLTELQLYNCDLERIPHSVFSLGNLQEIDFKGNSISTIEEIVSFQHLKRLLSLKLWHNQIVAIPPTISAVKHLERLNLSNNKLESLPPALFSIKKLRHLDLSHNLLYCLPKEIGYLANLQFLCAANNNLSELPTELFNCSKLRVLLLSHNCIKEWPAKLAARLVQLQQLEVKGNPIEDIVTGVSGIDLQAH
uniref:Leucine rich repeat containing 8 VRAC subunit Db n=1 Tax=Eptatretus burgeri TaxID=7764 RepID=A0A8C4NIC4_EPTBU